MIRIGPCASLCGSSLCCSWGSSAVVYESRVLVAPWGKLTMEQGALLEDRARARAAVSLTRKDWTLQLAPGWSLAAGDRAGDQRIVRAR